MSAIGWAEDQAQDSGTQGRAMKILMTGATGLVGTALTESLVGDGHRVVRLSRPGPQDKSSRRMTGVTDVVWDAKAAANGAGLGLADGPARSQVEGADAVVNLAGASVAGGRWTEKRKAVLRSSRIETTRGLISMMRGLSAAPKVLVSASAMGIYGSRGDEVLTEESAPGEDFLSGLAVEWEIEAQKAESLGMRVVFARFGVILAKRGGALPAMMRPFQFFVGGRMGSGEQWISWVTLQDVVGILRMALENAAVSGAINVVSPQPVRNAEFAKELGRAMHRPAVVPAPAFALRLALGTEMAEGMLLGSQRVEPQRLTQLGYRFQHSDLSSALDAVLVSP
jgi:uncharacterized protein (TIGR01777 family)